jgi:hypothetical protein
MQLFALEDDQYVPGQPAQKRRSVFILDYDDETQVQTKACECLSEAIASTRCSERPIAASFWYGSVLTPCTEMGITRAMLELRRPAAAFAA